jgi:opacity protein-like surface antigen
MKKLIAGLVVTAAFASVAYASAVLRYYNEDSTDYTWKATCSGTEYNVTFDHSKTSSVTIQGSTPCKLHAPSGDVEIKGDTKLHIKDGKVTVE